MSNFREHWKDTTLGSIFNHRKEKGHNEEELLSVTGSKGVVKRDSLERRDTSNQDKSKYLLVEKGDIVYNTMRMWQGVSGVSSYRGIVSPAYTVCSPTEEIYSSFAGYFLKDPVMVSLFKKRSQGLVSDTWNLKYENFAQLRCSLPPLPEQKKISQILSGIDLSIAKQGERREKVNLLAQANIRHEILRLESEDCEAQKFSMGEVCKKIFVGIASSTTHAYTDSTGVPMLRNQNIKSGCIDASDLVYVTRDFALEHGKKKLIKGDVITARTGYPGASAVVNKEFENCHSFTTLISRVRKEDVLPDYFTLYLNSASGKRQVLEMQAGGAQQNLNVSSLEKMIIPVPPISEQKRIIEMSKAFLSMDNSLSATIRQLQDLKKGISLDLLSGRRRVSI